MDERQDDDITLILPQALRELETKGAMKHSVVDPDRLRVLKEVYSRLDAVLRPEADNFSIKMRLIPSYRNGEVRIKVDMIDLNRKDASELVSVLRACSSLDIVTLNEDQISFTVTVSGVFREAG